MNTTHQGQKKFLAEEYASTKKLLDFKSNVYLKRFNCIMHIFKKGFFSCIKML